MNTSTLIEGRTMNIDFTGADGGRLAMAFGAGCLATFGFLIMIGRWLWGLIGKAKDDEIARMKIAMEEDRKRCADMETRLVQRVQTLEGFILSMAPGNLRQDFQRVISEQRLQETEK